MARTATRRALVSRPAVVSGNWWEVDGQTCVAAYQAIGAASLEASYVNLANPGTYNCTVPVTAPSFDPAVGWQFTANSEQYLSTNWPRGTSSYITVAIRITGVSNNETLFGAVHSSGARLVFVNSADRYYTNGSYSAVCRATGQYGNGVHVISDVYAYYNGNLVASGWPQRTENIGVSYVGCANDNGTATSFATVNFQAIAIYSTALSEPDVAALTTRMAALS